MLTLEQIENKAEADMFKMQSLYCTGIFFLFSGSLVEAISVDAGNLVSGLI